MTGLDRIKGKKKKKKQNMLSPRQAGLSVCEGGSYCHNWLISMQFAVLLLE